MTDQSRREPRRTKRSRGLVWAGVGVWLILGTALMLGRSRGAPLADTLWAEDGQLFLTDALEDPLGAILAPAGGYLHAIPRILAATAGALGLVSAAVVLSAGSALLITLLSCFVFFAAREVLPSPWQRATIAGFVVLLPAAGFESLANAANLQFFFVFASFWALVDRPVTWPRAVAGSAIALATAMSTTLALLLVPLSLRGLLVNRRPHHRVTSLVFLMGVAVQAFIVFRAVVLGTDPTLSQYPVRWSESHLLELPGLYGVRVVTPMVVGDRFLDETWSAFGWPFVAVATAVVVGGLLVGALHRGQRPWILVALAYSLAFFFLPVAARGTDHLAPVGEMVVFNGSRYVLVPMWFLVTAYLVLLGGRSEARERPPRRPFVARVAFVVLLTALVVTNYSVRTLRSSGPRWSDALNWARVECATRGDDDVEIRIPITPELAGPGWAVVAQCRAVTESG
jgi:hypothetical protein